MPGKQQRPSFKNRFILPSTKAYWREARKRPGVSIFEAIHGYVYLRWTHFYIRMGLGRHKLSAILQKPLYYMGRLFGLWGEGAKKTFADTYHAKVMPLDNARRLIGVDRRVDIDVPEKILPYTKARHLLIEHPADIALLRCPCRVTAKNPCEPMDVCVIVGKIFTDFVLEHHADKARRVSAQEALAVIEDCQMRGNVSHAFFKEAVLGRYYAICNCCSCCCGAMEAFRHGTPMLASSGYLAAVDPAGCVGCGKCAKLCPFAAVRLEDAPAVDAKDDPKGCPPGEPAGGGRKTARLAVIDRQKCMGCGVCALQCPARAIVMALDPEKPAPLEL